MKNFELGQTYTIELIPAKQAVTATITTLTRTIEDDGVQVIAKVNFSQLPEPMIVSLWDSSTTPTYTAIGQWNDDQANERILELLKAK
jgi:hypothetical protein